MIDQQGKKYNISNDEIKIENLLIKNSQIQFSVSDFKSKINAKEVSILSDVLIKDSDVRLDFEKFSYGNSIFTGIIHLKNVNEIKKFKYDGYFKNSTLNSSDFKTPITDLDIQIESFFEGNIDEIKFKDLNAKSLDNELITDLFVRFSESFNDSDIAFELKSFNSSTTFIYSLFPDLFGTVIPSALKNIGKLEMDGIFTKNDDIILSNANIKTEFGVIDYDIKLSNLKNINIAKYQGSFNGNSFDLAKIINLPFELQSDFSFSINGQGFDEENLRSSVVGQMNNVIINNYPYKKIMINGDVSDKQFTGSLIVDDNNLNLNFDGLINYSNDLVEYDFNANIKKANLNEINLSKVKKQSVFGNISAKLVGENFQSMIGDISFTDFILTGLDDEYQFENLTIQSRINNEKRFFNINSEDAVSGILIGDFNFLLLPTLMKNSILSGYNNYSPSKNNSEFDLSFNLNLKPKFANIISKKFTIDQNTFLSGEFDTDNYKIKIQTPSLEFSKVIVDDFTLNISNNSGNINISTVKSNYFNGENIEISLAKIGDFTNVDLNFKQLDNSSGSLQFEHTINPNQRSEFLIKELAFVFNGTDWQLKKQSKGRASNLLIIGDKYTELKPTKYFFIRSKY